MSHVFRVGEERESVFPSLFIVFLDLVSNRISILLSVALGPLTKPHLSASFAGEVVSQKYTGVTGGISG